MIKNNSNNVELQRAVAVCSNSQTELASRLTDYFKSAGINRVVTQKHVWNWLNRECKTPTNVAYAIEVVTEGVSKAYLLCPGEFPVPVEAA